jgi:hypothetical protein
MSLKDLTPEQIETVLMEEYTYEYHPYEYNLEKLRYTENPDVTRTAVLGGWQDIQDHFSGTPTEVEGLGTVEVIDSDGGEGQGEVIYFVMKISDGDTVRHFRKDGFYASHYGTDWDGSFSEVSAVQRTVTFWE